MIESRQWDRSETDSPFRTLNWEIYWEM